MENITFFVERYGVIAVFLNVLLDEGGLPLPSYPLLAIAGALSVGGRPQLVLVLVAALCASVLADNTWCWIARWHGRKALAQLCRITVSPDNCIRKTEAMFLKIGPGALLFVKFIPGLSNITVSLAGVTGVRPIAFIPLQMLGASLYLGVPILLGRLFYRTLNVVIHGIDTMGKFRLLGIAAAFAIYIVVRWIDRIRFMRQFVVQAKLTSILGQMANHVRLVHCRHS